MNEKEGLLGSLSALQRLALAYAPARAAAPTLALFALDVRLAGIVRSASEPMLAQLRLAWWREQLEASVGTLPAGEPLIAVLESWTGSRRALVGLAEGWEEMTGPAPLAGSAIERLAEARAEAFCGLCDQIAPKRDRAEARRLGYNWALADIAANLSHPEERRTAAELASAQDWRAAPMSVRCSACMASSIPGGACSTCCFPR